MKYNTFTCPKLVLGTLLKILFYGSFLFIASIVALMGLKSITTIAFFDNCIYRCDDFSSIYILET